MSPAVTADAPGHRLRFRAIGATAVVALLATVGGVAVGAATRSRPTAVPVASGPAPLVTGPADEAAATAPATTLDLSGVRALPPAGSGDEGAAPAADGTPVGLAIPSLGVDGAPVVPVGLDGAGGLEIPGVDEVGWYRLGARPGAGAGSVVLAAHVAYDGDDGVFRRLGVLEAGATVAVDTVDGRRLSYRVDTVTVHRKADLPIDDLFDPSSPERLVLITCGGEFNPQLRHYDSNVVAVATRTRPD